MKYRAWMITEAVQERVSLIVSEDIDRCVSNKLPATRELGRALVGSDDFIHLAPVFSGVYQRRRVAAEGDKRFKQ